MGEFNEETTNGWAELGKPTMGVKHLEANVNPRLKEQDEELIIRSQREPQERDACQELQLFIRRCSHPQTEVWWGGSEGGEQMPQPHLAPMSVPCQIKWEGRE